MTAKFVPTLPTGLPGITMRPFTAVDAPRLAKLAGVQSVYDNTYGIPFPYPESAARAWIAGLPERHANGLEVIFAISRRQQLIGSIGLTVEREHLRAEVGYWIGESYRGLGIARAALGAAMGHAFNTLALQRLYAHILLENDASRQVLLHCGFRREGTLRGHVEKNGMRDVVLFGMTGARYQRWVESAQR